MRDPETRRRMPITVGRGVHLRRSNCTTATSATDTLADIVGKTHRARGGIGGHAHVHGGARADHPALTCRKLKAGRAASAIVPVYLEQPDGHRTPRGIMQKPPAMTTA
jgi:hypothetical protein